MEVSKALSYLENGDSEFTDVIFRLIDLHKLGKTSNKELNEVLHHYASLIQPTKKYIHRRPVNNLFTGSKGTRVRKSVMVPKNVPKVIDTVLVTVSVKQNNMLNCFVPAMNKLFETTVRDLKVKLQSHFPKKSVRFCVITSKDFFIAKDDSFFAFKTLPDIKSSIKIKYGHLLRIEGKAFALNMYYSMWEMFKTKAKLINFLRTV